MLDVVTHLQGFIDDTNVFYLSVRREDLLASALAGINIPSFSPIKQLEVSYKLISVLVWSVIMILG